MHPQKFLGRDLESIKPKLSDEERANKLEEIGRAIAEKRKEAVDARKNSGIESVWMECEEAYLGIDDMNRHEFAKAQWAKPNSMNGPLTSNQAPEDNTRSTVYVRLTSRYVDFGAAKLAEIALPIDDKAFSIEPTPNPDLVKQKDDLTPLIQGVTGTALPQPAQAQPAPQPAQPGQAPQAAQPGQQSAQAPTVADKAKQIMDRAAESAKQAEDIIYDWMVEGKYASEMRKVFRDAARIGTGILKGPVPEYKTAKALTKIGGAFALQIEKKIAPACRWVDPWNFFPDADCGEDVQTGGGCFERDYISESALEKLKEDDTYLTGQIDKVLEEGPGKIYLEGSSPRDKETNKKRYEIWYRYGVMSRDDLEVLMQGDDELDEGKEKFSVIATMVNDTPIRAILHPLDSGGYPYRIFNWKRRPGHWAGVGVAEMMVTPQKMCNASTRAMLNNAGLSSGVQLVINQDAIQPGDGKWTITPNKVWLTVNGFTGQSVRDAITAVEIPSVQDKLMAIIEYAMKQAEESTGIPLITQGQNGETTPQTFGAAELQNTNAHTWIRDVGYTVDDQVTEPLVDDMYEWLLLDPNVPEDAKGDYKINAQGTTAMVERWIQEQVFMGLLNASMENPAFELDPAKIMVEYLRSKRIDPRKVKLTDEQIQERKQQQPPPPESVQVEQLKGQNAQALQQQKDQAELERIQVESQNEQQALAAGGAPPHQASAFAQIKREEIRAATAQQVEASRASAELARAQKEQEIAYQNGQFDLEKLRMERDLALLQYANAQKTSLDQVRAQLAKSAMDNQTKRELAAAEIQLAADEGDKDRLFDAHKHTTSLIRDEINTPNTP